MNITIEPRAFSGTVRVPASKSHTIRQMVIASMADGVSHIHHPLESLDASSCAAACSAFGADIREERDGGLLQALHITGMGGGIRAYPQQAIDVGNSGTTLFFAAALAALGNQDITLTGDEQIQKRSAAPLLDALRVYGAGITSRGGCAPITVRGGWKGGRASIECPTSQYLSALLLAAPLAPPHCITEIDIPLLNEKPYIEMTLKYLHEQCINFEYTQDFSHFKIVGGGAYKPVSAAVPGDFSSAAFPALAAVVSGGTVDLCGLDPADTQGDKAFFTMLSAMGADVMWHETAAGWVVSVSRSGPLAGGVFDLNATPDLLPAACVLAAYARGESALVNTGSARIKETDRIAAMAEELAKAGIESRELPDGIVIQGGRFSAAAFDGRGDHRIVMALACAALGADGPCEIIGVEAAAVTYPGFFSLFTG